MARFVPFATFVRRSLLATGDQWPHGGVLGQLPKTMKPTPFTSDAEPPPPRGGPLVTVRLASWLLRFRMRRRADTGAGAPRLPSRYRLQSRSGSPVSTLTNTDTCPLDPRSFPSLRPSEPRWRALSTCRSP